MCPCVYARVGEGEGRERERERRRECMKIEKPKWKPLSHPSQI